MEKLKIALLMTQSLESPTGLGRIGPIARELAKLGHLVEIVALTPEYPSLNIRKFESNGVSIHYVAPMHVKKEGNQKSYYSTGRLLYVTFLATWHLTRAAILSDADIIHISKPHPMNSIAGLAARYLMHKTLIVDCDDYEAGSGHFQHNWERLIVALFEKNVPKYADGVTTNTAFLGEMLKKWGVKQQKVKYLPNGVEETRFQNSSPEEQNQLRTSLGLHGEKVVSYIGSLSLVSHPVNLLLEAFSKVYRLELYNSIDNRRWG